VTKTLKMKMTDDPVELVERFSQEYDLRDSLKYKLMDIMRKQKDIES
jgi:hypothetical protein